jgi:hypothetical protein
VRKVSGKPEAHPEDDRQQRQNRGDRHSTRPMKAVFAGER